MTQPANRRSRLARLACVASAAAILLLPVSAAFAQAESDVKYVAVVQGSDVYVRCGAAESYYPFLRVQQGDLVQVIGEKYGWSKVALAGPAFSDGFGYIKHARDDTGRFRLSSDGATGVTLGRTDIYAPNLDAKNSPKDSWKSIARLEADQTLRVLETTNTEKDVVHKVRLPASAIGWISSNYVPKASESQAAEFERMLKNPQPEPAPAASSTTKPPAAQASNPSQSQGAQPTVAQGESVASSDDASTGTLSMEPTEPLVADGTGGTMPAQGQSPEGDADGATSGSGIAHAPEGEDGDDADAEPKPKAEPGLEDLEQMYEQLRKEPLETAELAPLRDQYLALASRLAAEPRTSRYAEARAEQLKIWSEAQAKRQELKELQARLKSGAGDVDIVRSALERSAEYAAVGRIAASTIYDGKSLPKLLRLQDPASGRTVAYLEPDEQFELVNRIDTIVGIVGEKTYDESLRLNIIQPKRIDVLTPNGTGTATATPEGTRPPPRD